MQAQFREMEGGYHRANVELKAYLRDGWVLPALPVLALAIVAVAPRLHKLMQMQLVLVRGRLVRWRRMAQGRRLVIRSRWDRSGPS